MGEPVLVMSSGGMDSTVLLAHVRQCGKDPLPFFVDYGQRMVDTEWSFLLRQCDRLGVSRPVRVRLDGVYSESNSPVVAHKDPWLDQVAAQDFILPYRNVLLLTAASAFAAVRGMQAVYAGFINSNHAKEVDASPGFLDGVASGISDIGGVRLEFPFRDWSKRMVLCRGIELGVRSCDTYSCQINQSTPCGACPNCVDRLIAIDLVAGREPREHYGST